MKKAIGFWEHQEPELELECPYCNNFITPWNIEDQFEIEKLEAGGKFKIDCPGCGKIFMANIKKLTS